MAITSIQLYVAFQKLFKTDEPRKADVLQFGVSEADFNAIDIDHNEYLGIDEALRNNSVSELLYSTMVSAYGSGAAQEAKKISYSVRNSSAIVQSIDPSNSSGNNPFAS